MDDDLSYEAYLKRDKSYEPKAQWKEVKPVMWDHEAKLLEEFNAKGHWPRMEEGKPDFFALDFEHHNGLMCEVCDEAVCVHCWARGREGIGQCEGVIIDGDSKAVPGPEPAALEDRRNGSKAVP